MFKNYFKIGWRNIVRNKVYSFINVLGLALGICGCIVIYLITNYDFSFDRFHPQGNRIYRITGEFQGAAGNKDFLNSPYSDLAGLQYAIPGFEAKAGVHFYGAKVSVKNTSGQIKNFEQVDGMVLTEPQYFDIFSYTWLAGSKASALSQPYKVVLTEKKARKYFGDIPAEKMIGKTVTYDDSLQVSVSGIIRDWKQNTDFGYTDFISIKTAPNSFLKNQIPKDDWSSLSPHQSMAFVKLGNGVTAAEINTRFAAFVKQHVKLPPGGKLTVQLQPLTDIHFTNDFHRGDDGDDFRKAYLPELYILMGVAVFILVLAAVNFVNLSTAQSIKRAKEIGIRKVLGSNRIALIVQFLTETFLLTVIAAVIAVFFVKPVLSLFAAYIPEGVKFEPFSPSTFLFLLAVTVITSLFAGMYPAKVLSSYLPVLSLKGAAVQNGTGHWSLRKVLIVCQFTISLVFIIAALIISSQIRYMDKADKGFKTDAIITLNNWGAPADKLKVLAQNIRQLPGVSNVILQGNAPMGFAHSSDNYVYKGKNEINLRVSSEAGDEHFIPFYQMRLVAGRNIQHSDSLKELVVNETLTKALGFKNPQDAVGKFMYGGKPYPIVGVVADFHEGSFHEAIQPVAIENVPVMMHSLGIKLAVKNKEAGDMKQTISQIESQWKKVFPETPFNYSFLNESIKWLYAQEKDTETLVNAAMIITIFISCMGLFGLGMFTAQLKTKEIGIRKVLGASAAKIAIMLSKDFIRLVVISALIASPIALYFMHNWLQDFAYRTAISPWIFIIAGLSAIAIALLTVSFQAVKAAIANPVKSLRTE